MIPESSKVYKVLSEITSEAKVIVFSGLPGVGKSLYVNSVKTIISKAALPYDIIQWDVARKAFETEYISKYFPLGDGTVHNGLKIIAGQWLMLTLKAWLQENSNTNKKLIIEAPFVGHRFVELAHVDREYDLEDFLSSNAIQFVVPIPTKELRKKIEEERARQVKEDARVWSGAKPSVMLMLWKMTCEIANEMGKSIDVSGQPEYDHEVYKFVYGEILKHRHFIPLIVDEIFEMGAQDESVLHDQDSLVASTAFADELAKDIIESKSEQAIDEIVSNWYKT